MPSDQDWRPPLARNPLHLIILADSSSSMSGDKIEALNTACHEVAEALRDADAENTYAEVLVRAITFSDGAHWHLAAPTSAAQFQWSDLTAAGMTDMGRAFDLLATELTRDKLGKRNKPPILMLLTDGAPTDQWEEALDRLNASEWGKPGRTVRVGIAVGRDADQAMLARFTGNAEMVWPANSARQLKDRVHLATVELSRQVSGGSVGPEDTDGIVAVQGGHLDYGDDVW